MTRLNAKRLIIRWGVILLWLTASPLAWSDVGTPCTNGDECEPGEVCAPGRLPEDPSFCTRRCGPDRPCPDAYVCEASSGLALCNTPIEYSQLGEACAPSCANGLLCIDDGNEEYCSQSCTLPGSCPEGYTCRPGSLNACAKLNSVPSIGEPCNENDGCSSDYECLALPNRTLPYCTYPCAEVSCPPFMVCDGEGETARCIHEPYARVLGDSCVNEAQDESTIGCVNGLSCEQNRDESLCTRDCSRTEPCPDGFGCVDRPDSEDPTIGRCLPDAESSQGLEPLMTPQMPSDNMMNESMGGAPYDNLPPINSDNDSMAGTNTDSGGCDQKPSTSPFVSLMLMLLGACLAVRKLFPDRC